MKTISDLSAKCIRCGFCLESCPTFTITGEETMSPRGRIYLIRSADRGTLPWSEVSEHLEPCLGCRACETACPSGVEYGALLELAREKLNQEKPHKAKQKMLNAMTKPSLFRLQLAAASLFGMKRVPRFMSNGLTHEPQEADLPTPQRLASWPPLDESALPAVKGEVALLYGCVMSVLFPRVHQATERLLRRLGFHVAKLDLGCCGSLHAHAGSLEQSHEMAARLASKIPPGMTLIANSAGCGSHLKDVLAGQIEIKDISEFLLENGLVVALKQAPGLHASATYHDACHLAHGQRVCSQPRELLAAIPHLRLVELPESDRCCGSAGIYNVMQPLLARQMLDRKWESIVSTGVEIVASGNPGCHAWIEQASREHGGRVRVVHTVELLEEAFNPS